MLMSSSCLLALLLLTRPPTARTQVPCGEGAIAAAQSLDELRAVARACAALAEQRRTLITAAQAVLMSGGTVTGVAAAAQAVLASGAGSSLDPPSPASAQPPLPVPAPSPPEHSTVSAAPRKTAVGVREKLATWHQSQEDHQAAQMAQQEKLQAVAWYPGKPQTRALIRAHAGLPAMARTPPLARQSPAHARQPDLILPGATPSLRRSARRRRAARALGAAPHVGAVRAAALQPGAAARAALHADCRGRGRRGHRRRWLPPRRARRLPRRDGEQCTRVCCRACDAQPLPPGNTSHSARSTEH